VTKTKAAFPDLERFVNGVMQHHGVTAKNLVAKWGSTRGADVTDMKKGNPEWSSVDRFARGLGYRGAVAMFRAGGDEQIAELLRMFEGLPDAKARRDVLELVRGELAGRPA
jgi:hypothetical protein